MLSVLLVGGFGKGVDQFGTEFGGVGDGEETPRPVRVRPHQSEDIDLVFGCRTDGDPNQFAVGIKGQQEQTRSRQSCGSQKRVERTDTALELQSRRRP